MKRFKLIIREIANYFYLRKVLNIESKKGPNSEWKKHNLRKNWYGRIYTVISLREEDMGEEEMVRNWKAMEMMRPINDYLSSHDLQEIIFPSIEKIPDSRSYLVVYTPIFKEFTILWLFFRLIFICLILSGLYLSIKMFI
jgi:hypothetical protein